MKATEVKPPLGQFQNTLLEKEDLFKLFDSINVACGTRAIRTEYVRTTFDKWWPNLQEIITKLPVDPDPAEKSQNLER